MYTAYGILFSYVISETSYNILYLLKSIETVCFSYICNMDKSSESFFKKGSLIGLITILLEIY